MWGHPQTPAISVPANPPLHRAVMDSHYFSHLFHTPTSSQQPQGLQAAAHLTFPLFPVPFP